MGGQLLRCIHGAVGVRIPVKPGQSMATCDLWNFKLLWIVLWKPTPGVFQLFDVA